MGELCSKSTFLYMCHLLLAHVKGFTAYHGIKQFGPLHFPLFNICPFPNMGTLELFMPRLRDLFHSSSCIIQDSGIIAHHHMDHM